MDWVYGLRDGEESVMTLRFLARAKEGWDCHILKWEDAGGKDLVLGSYIRDACYKCKSRNFDLLEIAVLYDSTCISLKLSGEF